MLTLPNILLKLLKKTTEIHLVIFLLIEEQWRFEIEIKSCLAVPTYLTVSYGYSGTPLIRTPQLLVPNPTIRIAGFFYQTCIRIGECTFISEVLIGNVQNVKELVW